MKQKPVKNHAVSVHAQLLRKAKEQKEDFNLLLSQYAAERLLYRLVTSQYSGKFILKGATLFTIWYGEPHRATKDLDFLSFGTNEILGIEGIFKAVCQQAYEEDGLEFFPETVKGEKIKEEQEYEGVRLKIKGKLSSAKIAVQIDIGFGDVITPKPQLVNFRSVLDFPSIQLNVYPPETVIAEKFQAMVALGIGNSRLKDFYDIWFLAQRFPFQGLMLCKAMKATFERRKTPLPTEEPLALGSEFSENAKKQEQWKGFITKGQLRVDSRTLSNTVTSLKQFLMPQYVWLGQVVLNLTLLGHQIGSYGCNDGDITLIHLVRSFRTTFPG